MSKITYIVSNASKMSVTFGSTSINSSSFNVPLTVEEDSSDDASINDAIKNGFLSLVSVTSVTYPSQDRGNLTTNEAKFLKSLLKFNSSYSYIQDAVLQLTRPQLLPIPVRVSPYKITGNTFYVDSTVSLVGSGSFSDPYRSPSSVTLGAGDGLLFKSGTTTNITAALSTNVSGTVSAPIVLGVYDSTTGTDKRVYGCIGLATINCGGLPISAIFISNRNYVCIDGLIATNNSGTNPLILVNGTSTNSQILNCSTSLSADVHIRVVTSGQNHLIEGNACNGSLKTGIQLELLAADTTSRVQFNKTANCVERGILIYDNYSSFPFSGVVACNSVQDASSLTGEGGICFIVAGGSAKVFRNTVRRTKVGIAVTSSVSLATLGSDFSGFIIENNTVSNCEFNISLNGCFGTWLLQLNNLSDAGSYTGQTWITPQKYGRNIELYGGSDANNNRDGTIRYNFCSGAYNWAGSAGSEGTEGVGIGIDNRTQNVSIYGNYCTANEGNGIQINSSYGCSIFGNICVDNCNVRSTHTVVIPDELKCEISFGLSPYTKIFNNTCVQTARSSQRYGICDSRDNPSKKAQVFNNLLVGASISGLRINLGIGNTIESNNLVVSAPAVVMNSLEQLVGGGLGTVLGDITNLGFIDSMYKPSVGSQCDNTGISTPPFAISLSGKSFANNTPIGALHA